MVSEGSTEFNARRQVAAPGAEVDAAEDDLFVAGGGEASDFSDHLVGRHAAALAAHKWDDAIRTAEIAAILNF